MFVETGPLSQPGEYDDAMLEMLQISVVGIDIDPALVAGARTLRRLLHGGLSCSQGCAGWNIVMTSDPEAAPNFGLDEHLEHDERYRRACEFHHVVTGLWESFADDAFLRNHQSGVFFDSGKLHTLDHKGPYFSVRGPLNIARPVQGRPVIVRAGASDAGRQLAAETADVIFAPARTIEDGRGVRRIECDVSHRSRRTRRRLRPAGPGTHPSRPLSRSLRRQDVARSPGPRAAGEPVFRQ